MAVITYKVHGKQEYYQIQRASFCNNRPIHQKDTIFLNVSTPNSWIQNTWISVWIQSSEFSNSSQGEGLTEAFPHSRPDLNQWQDRSGQKRVKLHGLICVLRVPQRRQSLGASDRSPCGYFPPVLAMECSLEPDASQSLGPGFLRLERAGVLEWWMGTVLATRNSGRPRPQDKVAVPALRLASTIQVLRGAESASGGAREGVWGIFKQ